MAFTNADLALKISNLIAYWAAFNEEYADWLGGTVSGGPGADGNYPLTDYEGNESLVACPAKLADNVSGYVGLASASETAAAASAAAALVSETAAALSETNASTYKDAAAASAVTATNEAADADSSATVSTAQANLATDRAGYAQEWAITIEDTLVSVAAGGNGTTDYSALHHAAKASADAASASSDAAAAAASAAAAATFDPALYGALADNEVVTGSWTFAAFTMTGDITFNANSFAPTIRNVNPDYTIPGYAFGADLNTGMGQGNADSVSLIAGGIEIIRGTEAAAVGTFDIKVAATATSLAATGAVTGANLNVTNWDTAYGWGDHAGLYSLAAHNHAGVYEPADATILKDADIGVTVAAEADYVLNGSLTQTDTFTYLNRNSANPVLQVAQVGAGDIVRFYKTTALGLTTETSGFTVLNYGATEVDVAGDAWTYRHLRAGVAQGGLYVDTIGQYWLSSAGTTVLKNPVGTKQLVTEDYMTFQQAAGGTAQLLQSTTSESGAGLNLPAIRWWEADGTSVAGMRAYQNPGSTVQSLRLGTGWFSEKLVLSSDDNHELWGKLAFESVDGQFINIKNPNHLKTDSNYNNWIQWRDSADSEVGWIGYGSSADNSLYMRNQCSGERIELYTSGGDVLCTVGATGALEVQGSSYQTNPTGPRFGQYTSTIGYVQAPAGGKIAIWNDATGEIASFNDDSTTYFSNDIRVKGAIKGTPNDVTWASDNIHFATVVGGGGYNANASSTTGYIRIKLPGSAGSSWMGGFDLHGYEYNSRGGWGVRISGYEYTTTTWYNESVEILYGSPPFDTCYWGGTTDTNDKYILLGSSGMTMAYPQLMISNYIAGYSNQARHIEDDWVVDISASTPTNWTTDSFLRVGGNIRWKDDQSGKNNGGNITINTTSGTPSGGNDGDIHFVY